MVLEVFNYVLLLVRVGLDWAAHHLVLHLLFLGVAVMGSVVSDFLKFVIIVNVT